LVPTNPALAHRATAHSPAARARGDVVLSLAGSGYGSVARLAGSEQWNPKPP